MNYRHAYHAGCFSDVVKHVALIGLIDSLLRKDTPFCYIDTHAGRGYYDLFSEFASKTKEYLGGIEKIIQQANPPPLVKTYLNCVHQFNNKLSQSQYASLQYYPGSPMIVRHFLRPHDRAISCELQLEEYQALKALYAGDKQMTVHHMDGFVSLKSLLPPREHRGLVLIDPSYEDTDEFTRIVQSLPLAIKKWETGIYAIWYPIKEKKQIERFHRAIKQNLTQEVFIIELTIYPDLPQHLNGCGLAIINPPWQFDQSMQNVLPWLWKALTINDQGEYRAFFLK